MSFFKIRDLIENTVKNYTSFLLQYLTWVDANLSKSLEEVSYEEIRTYILWIVNTFLDNFLKV
jgi:site-specific recombinase XerD